MSSPYPRDDFDAVTPPRDGRRGAHRAAPARPGGVLAPVVVALVVAASVGVGVVAYSTLGNPASASGAGAAAAAAGTEPSAAAQDPSAGAGAASAPAASPAGSPSASSSASAGAKAPVVVLNGTSTSGLAAKEAAKVRAQGWQVASTGNASAAQRSAHAATTVLYPSAQLEGSAKALAAAIGATAALDPSAQAGSLTVLLR
ncbi:LytR C-terminal domain-containing protein [Quadrisphaera oryzae]|uniref:LytR C-terminal domain-containing protein n=1 Tax=Quadrisphaera TaxID=317661 RepID=UPI001647E91A|nr:LytR C-terminal domain-containing protein [Quadrisphaera sp. RL12-1S]